MEKGEGEMSKAYKCDVCKRLYKNNPDTMVRLSVIPEGCKEKHYRSAQLHTEYDICRVCAADFALMIFNKMYDEAEPED